MMKLDHLTIPVRDRAASRDWYVIRLWDERTMKEKA